MRIGLRLLLLFFLLLGLALFVVLRVLLQEVKPGTRLAMEDALGDTATTLAALAAPELRAGTLAGGRFAQALAAARQPRPAAERWSPRDDALALRVTVTDARGIVVYDSEGQAVGQDHSRWNDVARTLQGRYGARSTPEAPDRPEASVMHVAAPVRDAQGLLGVLTVSRPNRLLEPYLDRSSRRILAWSWALLGVALLTGGLLTWWIASSVSRLRRYALAVAAGEPATLPRMGRLSGRTEFEDLAQAVEQMRLKLEDKAYVERYVHTLTHELKSPLAAIQGAAELLQEPLPEDERRRFAAHVQRQTTRLKALIERLLQLADLEQRRGLREVETLDLAALGQELLAAAEPRLRARGLQLRCAGGPAPVRGERFLLAQALQNLIDNAIDFSPRGGTLTVQATHTPREVRWSLRDEGPGVPDYARERVFDRFYSLPRPGTQERGSGLGLCMVREVAGLHRGDVTLNPAPGGGCEAVLTLPA
ncbi:two-component system sensor histidine kinase CreC [Piscinibacter sakaiensis]|uniref:histidine kinase n=1 Tax=Piscinibacter sakaiensis TaxID=1547922 RepID=A0A0K8P1J4_PISS1|nr:two-component system sensor histidine kinase CreC [Piscinibacter sakaiensis]GAP36501.1 two-component response regulator CreC [Piscinibacter sakaiensis]